MRWLCIGACSLLLSGCFIVRETQPVRMTVIPLPDKPSLSGNPEEDLPVLGVHAIKLRSLITAYNEMAREHNEKAGF